MQNRGIDGIKTSLGWQGGSVWEMPSRFLSPSALEHVNAEPGNRWDQNLPGGLGGRDEALKRHHLDALVLAALGT